MPAKSNWPIKSTFFFFLATEKITLEYFLNIFLIETGKIQAQFNAYNVPLFTKQLFKALGAWSA